MSDFGLVPDLVGLSIAAGLLTIVYWAAYHIGWQAGWRKGSRQRGAFQIRKNFEQDRN